MTLVTRLIVFKRTRTVKNALRTATCILSRRQVLCGRLGGVAAAAGSGFVCTIGTKGAGDGRFHDPSGGVAFDGDGNLVVSDYNNHRIQVLRYSDGVHLRTIGCIDEWTRWGRQDGRFIQPWGVAFDGSALANLPSHLASRLMLLATLLLLKEAAIACKCCATATVLMFAPSASEVQPSENSTALLAVSPSTATGTSSWLTQIIVTCKFSHTLRVTCSELPPAPSCFLISHDLTLRRGKGQKSDCVLQAVLKIPLIILLLLGAGTNTR